MNRTVQKEKYPLPGKTKVSFEMVSYPTLHLDAHSPKRKRSRQRLRRHRSQFLMTAGNVKEISEGQPPSYHEPATDFIQRARVDDRIRELESVQPLRDEVRLSSDGNVPAVARILQAEASISRLTDHESSASETTHFSEFAHSDSGSVDASILEQPRGGASSSNLRRSRIGSSMASLDGEVVHDKSIPFNRSLQKSFAGRAVSSSTLKAFAHPKRRRAAGNGVYGLSKRQELNSATKPYEAGCSAAEPAPQGDASRESSCDAHYKPSATARSTQLAEDAAASARRSRNDLSAAFLPDAMTNGTARVVQFPGSAKKSEHDRLTERLISALSAAHRHSGIVATHHHIESAVKAPGVPLASTSLHGAEHTRDRALSLRDLTADGPHATQPADAYSSLGARSILRFPASGLSVSARVHDNRNGRTDAFDARQSHEFTASGEEKPTLHMYQFISGLDRASTGRSISVGTVRSTTGGPQYLWVSSSAGLSGSRSHSAHTNLSGLQPADNGHAALPSVAGGVSVSLKDRNARARLLGPSHLSVSAGTHHAEQPRSFERVGSVSGSTALLYRNVERASSGPAAPPRDTAESRTLLREKLASEVREIGTRMRVVQTDQRLRAASCTKIWPTHRLPTAVETAGAVLRVARGHMSIRSQTNFI